MKELSIEKKAKAYDEALEIAKKELRCCGTLDCDAAKQIYRLFPELKESEDERIRKEMIGFFKGFYDNKMIKAVDVEPWLAWLEKQGEHANFRNKIQIGDKVTRNEDGVLVNFSQLKRIAKPAENKGKHNTGISEATKKKLEDNLNKALEKETPESLNNFLDEQDYQPVNTDYISGIRVGLLSIEGNAKNINGLTESQWVAIRAANRLLAEYIEKVQQKPWSEEDESHIRYLIECLEHCKKGVALTMTTSTSQEYINWLKSLRPQSQWKPSDAQIASITCAVRKMKESACYDSELVSLLNDLKKLKKE